MAKGFTFQTQGQLYNAMLGVGVMYSASHGIQGAPKNLRGGIEVVRDPNAVKVNTFHYMPKEDYHGLSKRNRINSY
jgi:hypothetical protein